MCSKHFKKILVNGILLAETKINVLKLVLHYIVKHMNISNLYKYQRYLIERLKKHHAQINLIIFKIEKQYKTQLKNDIFGIQNIKET